MSAKQETTKAEHKTKKFGKSERSIPHHTQKAKKFYPAEDEAKPKKVSEAATILREWASIRSIHFGTATLDPAKHALPGLSDSTATLWATSLNSGYHLLMPYPSGPQIDTPRPSPLYTPTR